jgi:chemotaxis protein CheX
LKAKYVNPFIKASKDILNQTTKMDFEVGKPYLKSSPCSGDKVIILIGITGDIKGQAMISTGENVALNIVSGMMGGMAVTELDEMSKSALSELGNMILGNTATLLYNSGVKIDITPPTLLVGDKVFISTDQMQAICVPLQSNDDKVELNIFVKE